MRLSVALIGLLLLAPTPAQPQPTSPPAQPGGRQSGVAPTAPPKVLSQAERMERWQKDPESLRAPAFAIATNLYYVGNKQFSSHLLVGTKEIVLFDTPYPTHFDMLTNSIRSVGVDPRKITLIVHTHAHYDHCAATKRVQ
ncbi:MAG: MBL fold metallo-hydrolase, partial [Verrucomicrobia bacterium]|nr:MBL fold metallo-hydrolase [Verrucomicrobiota bacterium]